MTNELADPRFNHLRAKCAQRGIAILRRGRAWLLEGGGIRLFVNDLKYVSDADLRPVRDYTRRNEP